MSQAKTQAKHLEIDEQCRVCGILTGLGCPHHLGALCANCDCPDCDQTPGTKKAWEAVRQVKRKHAQRA